MPSGRLLAPSSRRPNCPRPPATSSRPWKPARLGRSTSSAPRNLT